MSIDNVVGKVNNNLETREDKEICVWYKALKSERAKKDRPLSMDKGYINQNCHLCKGRSEYTLNNEVVVNDCYMSKKKLDNMYDKSRDWSAIQGDV